MANVPTKLYTLDKSGRFKVRWVQDGKRHSLHLGSKPDLRESDAHILANYVRDLIRTQSYGLSPTPMVTAWLKSADRRMVEALKRHGILPDGIDVLPPAARTLGELLDLFFEERTPELKPRSVKQYERVRAHLEKFYGRDKYLADITPVEAGRFRTYLTKPEATTTGNAPLAVATQRRRFAYVKEFFNFAVNRDILSKSPFRGIAPIKGQTENRKTFIPHEVINKLILHCPNVPWRTLIILARYLGLRTPSEPRELRWKDVDFERGRVRVTSPKTAHHEGKGWRSVPLFPEVRLALEAHQEALPKPPIPDSPIVDPEIIPQILYESSAPLSREFRVVIHSAGLDPWPVLWHSLRYSRQEELSRVWGPRQVCDWIGNSPRVAMESYLQTSDEDFRAAASGQAPPRNSPGQSGTTLTSKDIIDAVNTSLFMNRIGSGYEEWTPGFAPEDPEPENPNVLCDFDGTPLGTTAPAEPGAHLKKNGKNPNILGDDGVMRR